MAEKWCGTKKVDTSNSQKSLQIESQEKIWEKWSDAEVHNEKAATEVPV